MSEQPQPRRSENLLWLLLMLVAGISVFVALLMPATTGSRRAVMPQIHSRLRQIDLAKAMWAEDHHATGAVQITAQDLAPYFHRPPGSTNLVNPVAGETYEIGALGVAPQARLTRKISDRFPKGTVIRPRTNPPADFDIILPDAAGLKDKR